MLQPRRAGFAQTMAMLLFVIKEEHPNSKCTYYRFPKSGAKYSFDPKTEFSVKDKMQKLSNKWEKKKDE